MEGILPQGAPINRPPGFNGEYYSYWKAKFRVYVMASEYGLWRVFERGNYEPSVIKNGVRVLKLEEEYNENDKWQVTLNMKAIHVLQSALSQQEYFRICNLSSAKAMWEALEVVYEGTAGVKENRINTLMTEYDLLRMKTGESISEFQLRFTHLVNQLAALGKHYDQSDQVRKILNILTKDWEAKVTAIEEAHGESMQSVAALFGSLSEYEGKLNFKKGLDKINDDRKFGIVLNAENEESSDDDEEMAMIVRKFREFYKKDQSHRNRFQRATSSNKQDRIFCYKCGKHGHIKPECPLEDDSSDEESNEEEVANFCLVAEEQSEINEVNDTEPSYDEILSEYNELYIEYEKLAKEFIASKKKIKLLEEQV